MSRNDTPGSRACLQAQKDALRKVIADLQQQIRTSARVPARILAGDAEQAAQWKAEVAKHNATTYHLHNPPSPRRTVPQRLAIVRRLQAIKANRT